MNNRALLRIIDANLNRSREGLRVCEEIARFILEAPGLTRQIKTLRHRISALIKKHSFYPVVTANARDVFGDVGRTIRPTSERTRSDYRDIFLANAQRVKESLRVLEEFFKLIDTGSAAEFVRLRFTMYAIEKKFITHVAAMRHHR